MFIEENKDDVVEGRRLGVEPICKVLQVASSSYYAARDRPLSQRARRDAELTPRLVKIWNDNYQVYGSRKLWKTARRAGIEIGRDQTHRLMRRAGIQGVLRSDRKIRSGGRGLQGDVMSEGLELGDEALGDLLGVAFAEVVAAEVVVQLAG